MSARERIHRGPTAATAIAAVPTPRLNGWKEIASHLGVGVRTAQRWERGRGLPVHRIGRDGGEIVFAFADELARWATGDSPGPARPRPARPALAGPALALAGVALVTLWAAAARGARPDPGIGMPVAWTISHGGLTVRDVRGTRLFDHPLGLAGELSSEDYDDPRPAPVRLVDLDLDGKVEVLLAAPTADPSRRRLYAFSSDGRLLFVHQARDARGPMSVERLFVTKRPDGSPGVWAASAPAGAGPWRLEDLEADGGVRRASEGRGRISRVIEARWHGGPAVFVGGSDDATGGASLLLRDSHGRLEEMRFPRVCLTPPGEPVVVEEVLVEGDAGVSVEVSHGRSGPDAPAGLRVYYRFDRELALLHAEVSRTYPLVHAALEARGALDHRYGPAEDAQLFPVRRRDGATFVALPPVPVGH